MNKGINEQIIVLRYKIDMNRTDPFTYFSNTKRDPNFYPKFYSF